MVFRPTNFGHYELLGRLSSGGMAEVFRARDRRNDREVALKRILPMAAEEDEFVEMFEDEAAIAAELEHPHIARLLEFGNVGGQYFIAYELVDGKDLRAVFERAVKAARHPPLAFLLYAFCRIAEGLAYAHARKDPSGAPRSIVHRDVSPQNLMVSFAGDVKLIDFGIAKARGKLSRTAVGTIKGKFGYMSPEQVSGRSVDQRTDVFSLGICMWELLTLKRLFNGPNEAVILDRLQRHVPEAPSAVSRTVVPELDRIVLKALAKNPDERYGSARELHKDLYSFSENSGALATRADVARAMRATFEDQPPASQPVSSGRSSSRLSGPVSVRVAGGADPPQMMTGGRIMELQETRMSDENNGGSDLDIFEGLGKKSSARTADVPPPPGSAANLPTAARPAGEMKKTLMGIPGPALPPPPTSPSLGAAPPSSQLPAPPPASSVVPPTSVAPTASAASLPAPSAPPSGATRGSKPPPPPPGRGSLPNLASLANGSQPPASASQPATQKLASAVPGSRPAPSLNGPTATLAGVAPPPKPSNAKLQMDWDDDNEATHVFDKEVSKAEPAPAAPEAKAERANMDEILSSRPPPRSSGAPDVSIKEGAPATLSGAFGALGAGAGPASSPFRAPPPSQSPRTGLPAPPPSLRNAAAPPPPPPPGQTTTAPMHMPLRPPAAPPPPAATVASNPPPAQPSSAPPPAIRPEAAAARAMEQTAVVPRAQQGKGGMGKGLIIGIVAAVGVAGAYTVMQPKSGTLVVNVADAKGAAVNKLEVFVDGTKRCESAPCIVKDIASGVYQVKVSAQGFDSPAPRAVTIEGGKSATIDFPLVAAKSASTGFKVAGNQTGVKLSVDGKEVGPLPQELRDLTPGEHKLRFAGSERYAPLEKSVTVTDGEVSDLGNVSLKVLKGKAMIQLGTPGAKVYLVSGTNRKEVPQFPIAIDFDPNEHWQLEAKKDGMDDYTQPISFDDGQAEKTIVVTLNPKGTAAAAAKAAAAAAATAAVPVTATNPGSTPKPTEAPKSNPTPATAAPKKDPAPAAATGEAWLNINSLPASTVVLDGKPLGATPRLKVSVTPGSHTVLFVNAEQSLKKSITVTVGAGETKPAFAKLRDE
ncbi:serine/threonine protein kinase [Labilithrix luteola]|uniref:non-specific serine/threonine protein kinase n=1 Tax=Labilithrix luteola TaxID=1391654 RepID=A0A0K1Q8U8_9BACT|nr:serine/threonine-protein kinase [Labilithrix luteola]AKV02163.1 serine/threonine protein kinase [Labilithrix luteola]